MSFLLPTKGNHGILNRDKTHCPIHISIPKGNHLPQWHRYLTKTTPGWWESHPPSLYKVEVCEHCNRRFSSVENLKCHIDNTHLVKRNIFGPKSALHNPTICHYNSDSSDEEDTYSLTSSNEEVIVLPPTSVREEVVILPPTSVWKEGVKNHPPTRHRISHYFWCQTHTSYVISFSQKPHTTTEVQQKGSPET